MESYDKMTKEQFRVIYLLLSLDSKKQQLKKI